MAPRYKATLTKEEREILGGDFNKGGKERFVPYCMPGHCFYLVLATMKNG